MNYEGAPGLEFGGGKTKIDPSVAAKLPAGCRVVSTARHGITFWANSGRIDVVLEDGSPKSFFIKVVSKEAGRKMMSGEFESMVAIYSLLPGFAPEPIAWGAYETVPETYFFLCEFREMTTDLPDPHRFTARLAELHETSSSPNGKFGFHITTCAGNLPQYCEWEDSWEVFFSKSLKQALEHEIAAQGPDPEIDRLAPILFETVIPRLLRPLETEGRSVKPSLLHGDLWFANTATDADTDAPLVFDACCFYAHNEYELGQWRPVCNKFGPEYVKTYHSYMRISPPEEDYEGRLDLYKLRFNTHVSALFPHDHNYRTQMLGDMRDLIERYGMPASEKAIATDIQSQEGFVQASS